MRKRNKILLLLSVCMFSCIMSAENLNPILLFVQMPDSLCPYIDRQARMRMLELYRANDTIGVDNFTGGKSQITELTDRHITVKVSDSYSYTIYVRSDDWLYIETACAPICSSIAKIYTSNWAYKQTLPIDKTKFLQIVIQNELPKYVNNTGQLLEKD